MSSRTNLGRLNTADYDQVAELADRLEKAWTEQGKPVDLNDLLPPPGDARRTQALSELIKTDLEIRWRRGHDTRLEWYVEHYEELGTAANISANLIYEEYRVRQKFGDRPDLTSYKRRFPNQYAEVSRLAAAEPLPTVNPVHSTPSAFPTKSSLPMKSNVVQRSDSYHLLERLGTGSFGEVWKAVAPGGIFVAVKKIYKPVGDEADQHEIKALDHIKNLRHPYLLSTHSYWVTPEGHLHIAMELADKTLRDRLKECREIGLSGVPIPELLRLMNQAAQALDYVHSEGLFHRDIKPDNIMLMTGFAKVGDFGLVRKEATLSVKSAGAGTLAYMGPECFAGQVSKYSDQYSLAITYVELRTKYRPFPPRDNMFEAMLDATTGTPDLSLLDPKEQPIVRQALAKKPEERFPSCLAFVQALETALQAEAPAPSQLRETWLKQGNRVGPDGAYKLDHRRRNTQAAGQFWDAFDSDGKPVVLRVIDNLDLAGADKYLLGYGWPRLFKGARNILQVKADWLANAAGEVVSRAEAAKLNSSERLALGVVLEWFEDRDLSERFGGSRRVLDQAQARDLLLYLRQAAEALDMLNDAAHAYRGRKVAIRHCAIRPENLLLAGDTIKLADFSMAQAATETIERYKHDSADIDPPGYAAPELHEKGGARVTDRTDQYSLAMTYVKLRTGSLPFDQSQSHNRIIEVQLDGKLAFRNLPGPELEVITKATARRREDRYPNCVALIDALEAACKAEIVVEPATPAVTEATLPRTPGTHRPAYGGATPAHGTPAVRKWMQQGKVDTDKTIFPGQEATLERVEVPVVEVQRERVKPQPGVEPILSEEPRPARKGCGLSVTISLAILLTLGALGWQFWPRTLTTEDPPNGKGLNELVVLVTSELLKGESVPVDNGGKKPGQTELAGKPAYKIALEEFLTCVEMHNVAGADAAVKGLREKLLTEQDRREASHLLDGWLNKVRHEYESGSPESSELVEFTNSLTSEGISSLDLDVLRSIALLSTKDYNAALTTLATMGSHLRAEQGELPDWIEKLLSRTFELVEKDENELTSLLNAKWPTNAHAQVDTLLTRLLNGRIDTLVRHRYAGLAMPSEFAKLLGLIGKTHQFNDLSIVSRACAAECWLRQSQPIATKGSREASEADSILANLRSATDPYVHFVAGLADQIEGKWTEVAKHYEIAFRAGKADWRSPTRIDLAFQGYVAAASHTWNVENRSATVVDKTVRHYKSAVNLKDRLPFSPLVDFVEACCLADDMEYPPRLEQLVDSKEFNSAEHGDIRMRIALGYAAWADKNKGRAERLLPKIGPCLRETVQRQTGKESLLYWTARYYWILGETEEALKFFGASLALSPASEATSEPGPRFKLIEDVLGGFRSEIEKPNLPQNWVIVLDEALERLAKDRSPRYWQLLVNRWVLVSENKEAMTKLLVEDLNKKSPSSLVQLKEAVESSRNDFDLQIEARLAALGALGKATSTELYKKWSTEKYNEFFEESKNGWIELGGLLTKLEVLQGWRNPDKLAKATKVADQLKAFAKILQNEKEKERFNSTADNIVKKVKVYEDKPSDNPGKKGSYRGPLERPVVKRNTVVGLRSRIGDE